MKTNNSTIEEFKKYNNQNTTYDLSGTMSIINNEDEFVYNLKVSVDDNKYYKVSLTNNISNHEQVILKNDDGVYVVTPDNNKSFKFTSEWPNNSSQAYLIESLLNDVIKDSNSVVKETKDGYTIDTKVNYPNNVKLVSESIYLDKKYNIKKIEVKDKDNNVLLCVKINDINYKPKFNDDYFELSNYIKEDKKEETKTEKKEETKTTMSIEDIIYPLYVPSDTYLSSKDTVDTDEGNRVILTFAGNDPFILVEEVSREQDEMEIIPVNGEPLFIGGSIAALSNNSLYWTANGIDFYLTSKTLNGNEMMTIAESIQNSTSLVASTK